MLRTIRNVGGRTVPSLLEAQSEIHGDTILARDDVRALTYRDAAERVSRLAGGLAEIGVGRGDRLAVMSENRLEVVEVFLACAWLGAVFVPVNTALRGEQLRHVLSDSGSLLVLVEEPLADLIEDLPCRPIDTIATAVPLPRCELDEGDVSAILYTSGTTGPSKGVLCPHAQWYWWARRTGDVLGVRARDRLYTCLPFFHTNAINSFVQALLNGGSFHLGPRFSASRFWRRLADADADVTYLLGAMVHILSKREPEDAEARHRCRVALAPATPAELQQAFRRRFGIRLVDAWGSTETNIVIAGEDAATPPGSLGRPVAGFEARVVDADDRDLPAGIPGELVVHSSEPYAFALGYHGLPQQTEHAWRGGWFHTGDRVMRDGEGWFWFVDRLKDSIRRRGENISSYEVEAALTSNPDVAAAAVVPVPSEVGEDEVLAFVVAREGTSPSAEQIIAHCLPRLASFAVPRYVEFVDALPLTANGKVEKFRLRERGIGPATWDRERERYAVPNP